MATNFQVKFSANRVDVDAGIIFGVSLLTEGAVEGHQCFADATTLKTVLAACKRLKKLKTKANHGPDVGAIVGSISNFRIEGNQVKGDLTLLKNSPHRNFVLEIAKELSDQFGLSIAFEPIWESKDGKELVRCKTIWSADIVDAPAANRQGLFDATPTIGGPTVGQTLVGTNTDSAVAIPTGHKIKGQSVGAVCPQCEKTSEFLSKLVTLHDNAADHLEALCSTFQPKDDVSSGPTEKELQRRFEARLEAQRLELTEKFEKQASITACRMLAKTGVRLSTIPDADTAQFSSGNGILDQLDRIENPTEKGRFYQHHKEEIQFAFQRAAANNLDAKNRLTAGMQA